MTRGRAYGSITLGGVGVGGAVRPALPVVPEDILFEIHRNVRDESENPAVVVRALPPRDGAHRFDDYARNGTVADGFRTALKAVMGAGPAP